MLAGALGCPNCRERYPIQDGWADLRPPPRAPLDAPQPAAAPDPDTADRLAALLGVAEGPGHVGLLGSLAVHAAALADRVPGVEVVAVAARARGGEERVGVSRLVAGSGLPFQPRTFRALATTGELVGPEELVGLVGRGGRIVVERPTGDTADRLERASLRILLRGPDWVAALQETS